jgi:SecD/SecF fusion protein
MRNKTTIVVLLAVFSVICLMNLFFTYRSFSMDGQLKNSNPEQEAALRNDKSFMASYEQAQRNAFSLGLDLQGGLFLTMEVGVENVLREYAGIAADEEFNEALKRAIKEKETSQSNLVDLFTAQLTAVYKEKTKIVPQKASGESLLLARYFGSQARSISSTATDEEIIARLKSDTESAVQNAYTIIRSRVDQFGVASPNLNLDANTGRIYLELPGVKDPNRVKRLLGGSAKLEFRETWTYAEAFPVLDRIDAAYKRKQVLDGIVSGDSTATAVSDTTAPDSGTAAVPAPDSANATAPVAVVDSDSVATSATADVFGAKSDSDSISNDSLQGMDAEQRKAYARKNNPFRALFNLEFPLDGRSALVGVANLTDTATINKLLADEDIRAVIPIDMKFLWEAKPNEGRKDFEDQLGLVAIKTNRDNKAPLEGDVIVEARQNFEPGTTSAMVAMNMNSEGGKIWSRITRDNVGKNVAIVLDDYVQSYPTVQGMISGGRSTISGNFSVEEAKDLANLLQAGALPVKVRILGDSVVGPSLGAENLTSGMISFLVAFLSVIVFMAIYYGSSGVVASVALVINLLFLLAVSAALNVVFTLPGLAAVVLTMGMAVDANVLIFERIREEQAKGKGYKASIQAGFANAFSSIMDSNITTFLTGLILFSFGIGPIRGFAVALMIGIVTSLIAALFVTRLIIEYFTDGSKENIQFSTGISRRAFNFDVKMTQRKKLFYGFSIVLSGLSLISIFALGFRTGVDFKGGRQIKVAFTQEVGASDVRAGLTAAYENENPLVREIAGAEPMLLITTSYKIGSDIPNEEIEQLTLKALEAAKPGSQPHIVESTVVGPTVASDIKISAVYSVIFSLIAIFLYILFRFRRLPFGVGAVSSLFHDVIVAMGMFSFFGVMDIFPFALEVDQAFIAACLTIIGYSINDTVIVFDRIRENLVEMKSATLGEIFNTSINQTLARTIVTSGTTLLTVVVLLLFGGDGIRGFMFALFIGIGVGTYSSIFVASPIAFDMMTAQAKGESEAEKKPQVAKA